MGEKKSKETVLKYALQFYNLTEAQLYCANEIISFLNKEDQVYYPIRDNIIIKNIQENYDFIGVTKKDISYTLKQLDERFYFIEKHFNSEMYKITLEGREIIQVNKDFIEYLAKEIEKQIINNIENHRIRKLQDKINNLKLQDLEGSIFKTKYAWLFILANAVLTIIISVTIAYIIKRMGLS